MPKKASRRRRAAKPRPAKFQKQIQKLIKKGRKAAKAILEQKIDLSFGQAGSVPRVMIVAGSRSDISLMQEIQKTLEDYGIESNIHIASAHRTPELVREIAGRAEQECDLVIAGAGLAAALPGAIAAQTVLPVIGLPIKTESLNGLDALVSILQMPPGVPVATVAINGSKNAALLAVQILSLKYPALRQQFRQYKQRLAAPPTDVQLA